MPVGGPYWLVVRLLKLAVLLRYAAPPRVLARGVQLRLGVIRG
jgi:hypothetical protein